MKEKRDVDEVEGGDGGVANQPESELGFIQTVNAPVEAVNSALE